MGMRIWKFLWPALICLTSCRMWAGQPGRFTISQVSFQAPIITAYLDVLDQNGEPPAKLTVGELSATIQGTLVSLADVTPFDASGEGVAYIFLVDVSKSIQRPQFEEMKNAMFNWIDGLNGNDRMAIFTFGEQDKQLVDFTADKESLKAALRNLVPTDMQTKLYLALKNAIDLRQRADAGLPNRRVIVILSDGKDEGSGMTAGDLNALLRQSPMPIYAIGSSRLRKTERTEYLDVLNRMAVLSGGLYVESGPLAATYNAIKNAIRRVFVAHLNCDRCQLNPQPQPMQMTLTDGTVVRTALLAVNLFLAPAPAPEPRPIWQDWRFQLALAGLLIIVLIVVITIVVRMSRKPPEQPIVVTPPTPVVVATPVVTQPAKPAEPGRSVQLTVISGNERGRSNKINLSGKATIGRDAACEVAYPSDPEMSAKHYELIQAGAYVEVADLGSTNGTLLNGARLVTRQRLEDGDLVRAGRTEVRINFGAV